MNDLEFIIINSKLLHAKFLGSELERRVSFDVFQDNEIDDVWNVMEGGKDDIFVYDRCGRLAFFIPYPFSVMTTADGLVPSAIISTYFDSPCGNTCEKNTTSPTASDPDNIVNITQSDEVTTNAYYEQPSFNVSEDIDFYSPNDTEYITVNYTMLEEYENSEEYQVESNVSLDVSNKTNDLHGLYFNHFHGNTSADVMNFKHVNKSDLPSSSTTDHNANETDINNFNTTMASTESTNAEEEEASKVKKKSDRCKEADFFVCKDFSKKKLLKIQMCCDNKRQPVTCRNFGKKRCKKMQPVLKCCFKSAMVGEISTTTEATVVSDVVCCRDVPEGRFCRVSETGVCEYEREYISTDETPTEASM